MKEVTDMNKKFNMFILIIVSAALILSGSSYEVTLLKEDAGAVELNFRLNHYRLTQKYINGTICDFIELKNCAYPLEKDAPAVPYVSQSIIIPGNAEMTLEICSVDYKEIGIGRIVPSQGGRRPQVGDIHSKTKFPLTAAQGTIKSNRKPAGVPYNFGERYAQDKWYPQNFVRTGQPYILRDYRGLVVYFQPFLYNPVKGVLRVAESIHVKIKKTGVSYTNTLEAKHKRIPHTFSRVYKNHFINYANHVSGYPAVSGEGNMIVITTGEFKSAVEPLVKWKNRKGIKTGLYLYPTDTGSTSGEIKSFIRDIYDSETGLTYILIVGDAEDVPPAEGNVAAAVGVASDPVYTLLAGDDYYADAFIGRFSVTNPTEARTVVNKNLWYEKSPDPTGQWYHKAAGIACDDRYFTPHPREIVEEIRDMMLAYHYTEFTTIYAPGAAAADIFDAVNDGRGWINVYEHGWSRGWSQIGFETPQVAQLENSYKTPVVIACSCSVGKFNGETCFAENWQRLGTPDEPKGSIVFMGSSAAIWNFSWIGAKEMVNHLVNENYFTAGEITFNGVMKVIEMFPEGPRFEGPEIFQMWHLFGDPSLLVYSDTPTEMTVNCDSRLPANSTSFTVHVEDSKGAVERASVALYMNNKLYGSAYTDRFGSAEVTISDPLPQSGQMEVNVTAYNKVPYFGTVKISIGSEKVSQRPHIHR